MRPPCLRIPVEVRSKSYQVFIFDRPTSAMGHKQKFTKVGFEVIRRYPARRAPFVNEPPIARRSMYPNYGG